MPPGGSCLVGGAGQHADGGPVDGWRCRLAHMACCTHRSLTMRPCVTNRSERDIATTCCCCCCCCCCCVTSRDARLLRDYARVCATATKQTLARRTHGTVASAPSHCFHAGSKGRARTVAQKVAACHAKRAPVGAAHSGAPVGALPCAAGMPSTRPTYRTSSASVARPLDAGHQPPPWTRVRG